MTESYNDLITRYVPELVLRGLNDLGSAKMQPIGSNFDSAVLFADISGFTTLTESLANQGEHGVEQLTQILNAYFGQIITVIKDHGGDIIKFAGDAMLAFWPVDNHDLAIVTQHCTQAALAVQSSLKGFSAPGGVKLALRVSVAAGPIRSLQLGGMLNRWETVVAGQPIIDAGVANDQALAGEVVLSPGAWNLVKKSFVGKATADNCMTITSITTALPHYKSAGVKLCAGSSELIESYIPGAVRNRIRAGQTQWLTELRKISILFVNLPSLNAEVPIEQAQQAIQGLQKSLYQFEGSLNKLSVDDKGVTLVAAFGMPPLSHTDDPHRAVGAALQIQRYMQEMAWQHSIGITTGRTFCGVIGNDSRCEYTIIGDVVNLSARLMQASKGGILCDHNTYQAAQYGYQFAPQTGIYVKGKSQQILNYQPLKALLETDLLVSDYKFFGRSQERQVMDQLLKPVSANEPADLVIFEGDTGLGKSCLINELSRKAPLAGINLLAGAGSSLESCTLYRAWREIFKSLIVPLNERQKECFDGTYLAQLVPENRQLLLPLLKAVLPVNIDDNDWTQQLTAETRATQTNDLLIEILKNFHTSEPLALAFDDCQWLDSSSWTLLLRVIREQPQIPIVLLSRSKEIAPQVYQQLQKMTRSQWLSLTPLDQSTTSEIICNRLKINKLPALVSQLIYQKAQGNPLFSLELAFALRDDGTLKINHRECALDPKLQKVSDFSLEDTVQDFVTSRIDSLTAQQQLLLKVASTIGTYFNFQLLHDICPLAENQRDCKLDLTALCERDMMANSANDSSTFFFKHIVTQEVAYQLMPHDQRRPLHAAIAGWYERHDSTSNQFGLLAKHWQLAGKTSKATEHLVHAGDHALNSYANDEAISFFKQAVSIAAKQVPPLELARWYCALAEAHYRLGQLKPALDYFNQCLQKLGHATSENSLLVSAATLLQLAKQTSHRLLPRFLINHKVDVNSNSATRIAAAAYERVAQIHYLNNAKVPALHAAFKALNLLEKSGLSADLARSYANVAICYGLLMQHSTAQAYTQRALQISTGVNQAPCSAYVQFVNGLYWITVANWPDGTASLESSYQLASELGDWRRWDENSSALMWAYSRQGDFNSSLKVANRAYLSTISRNTAQGIAWALCSQLWALLPTTCTSQKITDLQTKLHRRLENVDDIPPTDQILSHSLLALSYSRRGDHPQALLAVKSAQQLITASQPVSHYLVEAHSALIETLLALWNSSDRPASLDRQIKKLLRSLTQLSRVYPFAMGRRYYYQGCYFWQQGQFQKAELNWQKSLIASKTLLMPYEQALAHCALAGIKDPISTQQDHKLLARTLFKSLSARYHLEQIQDITPTSTAGQIESTTTSGH